MKPNPCYDCICKPICCNRSWIKCIDTCPTLKHWIAYDLSMTEWQNYREVHARNKKKTLVIKEDIECYG